MKEIQGKSILVRVSESSSYRESTVIEYYQGSDNWLHGKMLLVLYYAVAICQLAVKGLKKLRKKTRACTCHIYSADCCPPPLPPPRMCSLKVDPFGLNEKRERNLRIKLKRSLLLLLSNLTFLVRSEFPRSTPRNNNL